jgi:hypothetical protein
MSEPKLVRPTSESTSLRGSSLVFCGKEASKLGWPWKGQYSIDPFHKWLPIKNYFMCI